MDEGYGGYGGLHGLSRNFNADAVSRAPASFSAAITSAVQESELGCVRAICTRNGIYGI